MNAYHCWQSRNNGCLGANPVTNCYPVTKLASIAIDVDSIRSHLQGYGVADADDIHSAYVIAVPRILELFARHSVVATFFLVADEAKEHAAIVRSIVSAGHEVACHSLTHPVPFEVEQSDVVYREIIQARTLLEELTGQAVKGFRAPSWCGGDALLESLAKAGYLYDASSYPAWFLALLRFRVNQLGESQKEVAPASHRHWRKAPYVYCSRQSKTKIVEIPISTSKLFGIPYYHTLRFILPGICFRILRSLTHGRSTPIHYTFHAVDFLEIAADNLDQRMSRHPGMTFGLQEKLQYAEESVCYIASRCEIRLLKSVAQTLLQNE